ncbi:MAG: hypothetical protein IT319_05400 [Anaerolineae bacterium]|nr:hypothetical protein [Anaerolineae bacterium]
MMTLRERPREKILETLNSTVADAAEFFSSASPILSNGRHTAHSALAQIVFWHERYLEVLQALAAGQPPNLIDGTTEMLNAAALHRYAGEAMPDLARQLTELHREVDRLLSDLPDWSVNFPVKRDSGFCNVDERVQLIEENMRNRTTTFRRLLRPQFSIAD